MNNRPPAVAGTFYPAKKAALEKMVEEFLEDCEKGNVGGKLRALVVPHAGYAYSGVVAAAGYRLLSLMEEQPKKIVLIGPSHYAAFYGLARPSLLEWDTPLGMVKADFIEDLAGKSGLVIESERAHAPEHSLEVQLPFLKKVMKRGFTVFPVLSNQVNAKEAAEYLGAVVGDSENFIIVSSDLSHYLPYQAAKKTDEKTSKIITGIDLASAAQLDACGRMGIEIAMSIAKDFGWKCAQIDLRNSGDTAGDKSAVVGYGCFAFFE